MEIFRLFGSIFIENEKANKSLKDTDQQAEKVGKTLQSTIKTASKWGVGIAAAATAAGGAIFALASKSAATGDRIDKLSQKIGLSRQAFQEWEFILSQNGASVEGLQMGLKTLSKAADEAGRGVSTYTRIFDRLGISVRDSNGEIKGQEQLFNETILALSRMENETERTSLATQLLGRSAQELAPMLNSGAQSIEELRAKAHELGLVIEDDAIDASVRFTDLMDQLKRSLGAVVTRVGASLLPTLNKFVEWTVNNVPKVVAVFEFIGEVVGIVFKYVRLMIGDAISWVQDRVIGPFSEWLISVWAERGPPIVAAVEELWDGVKAVFSAVFDALKGLWEAFILVFRGDWETAWNKAKETFSNLWSQIPDLFAGIWDLLVKLADQIMTAVIDVIRAVFGDNVADHFQSIWDAVLLVFDTFGETFMGIWRALSALFQGDWAAAWEAIQGVVQTAWGAIENVIQSGLEIVNTIIDGALNGIVALVRWAFGDEAADAVDDGLEVIRTIVDTVTQVILGIVRTVTAFLRGDWSEAWDEIKNVATTIWNSLPAIFEQAMDLLIAIADAVMISVLNVIRSVFGDDVSEHFRTVWDAVKLVFETVTEALLGIWRTFSAVFQGDWEGAWDELKATFLGVWDALPAIVQGVLDGIFGIVDTAVQAIIDLIRQWFGDGVADVFQTTWDAVTIVFETARDTILGILRVFTSLFKGEWEAAWQGIKDVFAGIWNGITSIFTGPLNGITTFVAHWAGRIVGSFVALKDLALGFVRDMVDGIKEWFSETKLGQTFGWLGDQIGRVTGFFADMYKAVVGNSYVPDMVEEIGEAVERLKDKLARPVAKYTAEALASFGNLEEEAVAAVMSMADAMDGVLDSIASTISGWISETTRALFNGTATWAGILNSFAGAVGNVFGTIFDTITKELVANIIKQNEWLVATLANIATAITGLLSQAYATLVAFFAWSGPLAPVLAGGVITAAIAGIASLAGSALRGLLPDPPSTGGGGGDVGGVGDTGPRGSGRQVSEITGPTRDLLVDLLKPLANLNSIVSPIQDIRDILDARLPDFGAGFELAGAGVGAMGPAVIIENLNVTAPTTGVDDISRATIDQIEKALAGRIAKGQRGRGGR